MTIAACYVSSEGVVLGADSTATYSMPNGSMRHHNNTQKVFEIGEMGSTLGIVTWGMSALPNTSFRQLVAQLSDSLIARPPATVEDSAHRWNEVFWPAYSQQLAPQRQRFRDLSQNPNRSPVEQAEMIRLNESLFVGFCLGGHVQSDRSPQAFQIQFDPGMQVAGTPLAVHRGSPLFRGMPNIIMRLLNGVDENIYRAILSSPHWTGGQPALDSLIVPNILRPQTELPLREAIDWIYSSIFITIKAIKFSGVPPMCGGPIEVAAITSDRRFRWVCHKGLDQALSEHFPRGTY